MKFNSILLPIVVVALAHLGYAQLPDLPDPLTDRFLVNIAQVTSDTSIYRCSGTPFTTRHVLTTATCVIDRSVIVQVRVLLAENGTSSLTNFHVARVFIHDDFVATAPRANNVAVVHTVGSFAATLLRPRTLGTLAAQTNCVLHGWGGTLQDVVGIAAPVAVLPPVNCNPQLPQVFCSRYPITPEVPITCTAQLGAPLTCGPDANIIAGFLIDEGCVPTNSDLMLNYHSVAQFTGWLNAVSGSDVTSKMSMLLIVSAALMSMKKIL